MTADIQNERITIAIGWGATGVEDRKGVYKYVRPAAEAASQKLKSSGWRHVTSDTTGLALSVDAWIPVESIRGKIEPTSERLDDAVSRLRFGGQGN